MIVLKIIGWVLLSVLVLILLLLSVRVRLQLEYSKDRTSVHFGWLFLKKQLYPAAAKKGAAPEEAAPTPEPPPEAPPEPTPEPAPAAESETQPEQPADAAPAGEAGEQPSADVPAEAEASAAGGAPTEEKKTPPAKKKSDLLETIYSAHGIDGLIAIFKRFGTYTKTFFGNLMRGVVVDELYLDVCCTRSDAAATALYYGEVCAALFPLLGALASRCRWKKYNVNIYPDFIARFSDVSFFVSLHVTPVYMIGVLLAYGAKLIFGVALKLIAKPFLSKKKTPSNGQKENIKSAEKSEVK